MNGFINVLKPVSATASDVVVCLKKILGEKKIGHLGTLDPGAAGVLPVAVGKGTKLFNYLTDKTKYYRAFFTFGKTTDTLDAYGTVTDIQQKIPTAKELEKVLDAFVGEIEQVPPAYSAISVGGVRSYKLARMGECVVLKSRKITVFAIKVISQISTDTFVLDIKCSGGTYIRSLARDIAYACDTVGYMSGLIRLASGCFDISRSFTVDQIREQKEKCLLDIMYPLRDVECFELDPEMYSDLDHGRRIYVEEFDGYRKVYCNGEFFGLGKCEEGILKLEYYLKDVD